MATAIALLAVAACSDSPTKGGNNSTPAALSISSGDHQVGMPGAALAAPIAAKVTNSQGNPVAGKAVDFTVTRGEGTVASATVTTDNNGVAQTSWTLGSGTVRQEVKATINSLVQTATATVDTTRSLFLLPLRDTVAVNDTIWVNMIAGTSALGGETRGAVQETITSNSPAAATPVSVIYTRGEFLDLQQPTSAVLSLASSGPTNGQPRQLYIRVGYLARQLGSGHDVRLRHTASSVIGARTFTDLTSRVSVVGASVHIR